MKLFLSLLLTMGILSIFNYAIAGDPVDLSGKQGIIDPQDLKSYDPKPPKVEGKAPPPPSTSNNSSSTTPPAIDGSATGTTGTRAE